jgi:ABC transport system ATP-binding/permease protein
MNQNTLNLAVRTAVLLRPDQPGVTHSIYQYFGKLGVKIAEPEMSDDAFEEAQIDELCREINNTLESKEKICLLLLVQDCLLALHDTPGFLKHLEYVFRNLGIESRLVHKFRDFLMHDNPVEGNVDFLLLSPKHAIEEEMPEGRWIEDNAPRVDVLSNTFDLDHFSSHLLVMFVDQIKSYVIRCINLSGPLFDEDAESHCRFRILGPGHELSIKGVPVITFSGLKSRFHQIDEKRALTLDIDQIKYSSARHTIEVHSFSTTETTGQLIGIVGREGVGKSSLLKMLAGKLKPDTGGIYINGCDLWRNKYLLKGVIGFIPEEDLLFEELSVFDNLSLTAQLYYSSLGKKEIALKVNTLLSKLDLLDIKHVVVGKFNSKHIQPGQRRLINIALELLREPQILLVDNALSGLGMSDASKVIKVLHDYSFMGNLVITTISQADSETFMLFDKIWVLDEGGRAVYVGPVKDAPGYFLQNLGLNYEKYDRVDPTQLLDMVSYRLPDKEGLVWKRVLEPEGWHNLFLQNQIMQSQSGHKKATFPARILKIPNLEVQLLIFSIRNFKCKFSRMFDIIKAILVGPAIALFLAFLFRTSGQGTYFLDGNRNLPAYLFASVIAAIFMGLTASIDEIVRERDILEKEEYLEFSRFSYLNSKILYLFPVISIQILLYVFAGNLVMGIKELFWVYWLVLFSSACFGALLGLVFSASVTNRSILYKVVLPMIITLQLIFGGYIVPFQQLNLGNDRYTPLITDLMASRWGYEALAVEQFKDNRYEKKVYPVEKKLDQAASYVSLIIPTLEKTLTACSSSTRKDSIRQYTALLQNELRKVAFIPDVFPFEYLKAISEIPANEKVMQETSGYLTYIGFYFYQQNQELEKEKRTIQHHMIDSLGTEGLVAMKRKYHNEALERLVTHQLADKDFYIAGNEIIRTRGMIYQEPASNWGRAQFFCPVKRFNDQKTETLWFNMTVIWMLTALCYVWMLFDITGLLSKLFPVKR